MINRDTIINLAHETECLDEGHYGSLWMERFELFAALVAAAEREACAKVCERVGIDGCCPTADEFASAIRARRAT